MLQRRERMPELDAVRGFAALLVMLHHLSQGTTNGVLGRSFQELLRLGWLGVDIFFVLSGFLITGVLLRATKREANYYRDFYVRRAFRIFPLYYLGATLIFLLLGGLQRPVPLRTMEFTYAFLMNMDFFFGFAFPHGPLSVYWSLAVEEHFYLVWPAVIRNVNRRAILWACAAVLVLSPLVRYFAVLWWSPRLDVYVFTFSRLDGFALGSALALLVDSGKLSVCHAQRLAMAMAAIGIAIGGAVIAHGGLRSTPFPAALSYTAADLVIAAAFVWLLILCRHGTERRGILRPFGFLGDVSYCTYIIHCSVMLIFDAAAGRLGIYSDVSDMNDLTMLVRVVTVVAGTIVVAALSRRYYEMPMLSVRDRALKFLDRHASRAPSVT